MIKVSIIVPVWNTEKYLRQCLDSLVNQTLKDIEIIIVNDGSPDNSDKIIKEYEKKYPEIIKYIVKENGGLGSARNKGLEIAQGEYIGFVDSDDWVDLKMYEKMHNEAIKNNGQVVICDMIDHFEDKDLYLDCTNFTNPFEKTPSACNKIFSRKIIGNIRFLEKNIWYEDLNFTSKMLFLATKVLTIKEGYYHCHAHENSIMNNNNSLKNLDIITSLEGVKEFCKNKNIYNEELISYMVFEHILITAIMRVGKQKNKDKKKIIKKLQSYCKENLGNYKKYEYYKTIPRNRKIIANLNYHGFYKLSDILLQIKSKI